MRRPTARSAAAIAIGWSMLAGLLALRLPAIVEPAGNDQSLYMYVADTVRRGGVPYVDAWDQKPPGIFFVYAAVRALWPRESAVAVADVIGAGVTAWLLVGIGRRLSGPTTGFAAAAIVLLFGHPSIARLSGVYLRGQCEVFIAAAIAGAIALVWRRESGRGRWFAAGVCLGAAFWLKYNALAYALPIGAALVAATGWRARARAGALWIAAGALAVSAVVLGYFAAHGALQALRVATIDYNLRYSGETYTSGPLGAIAYVAALPFGRARADVLWFFGLAGAAVLAVLTWRRERATVVVVLTWIAAAVVSIAVNGARDLPQYFIQAAPALALAGAVGAAAALDRGWMGRAAVALVLLIGLWRIGTDSPAVAGLRWGGLPQLADNLRLDVAYLRGRVDRLSYLSRFKGAQKYDAAAVATLADHIRETTGPRDRILVFGFAPAVYLESERQSASRFLWSRPVVLEFEADRPGYGSRGLLDDLRRTPPAIVALEKHDWGPGDPNSEAFFLGNPDLHAWLSAGYVADEDTPVFSVWKRR